MNNKFETLNISIKDVINILIDIKFKIFIIFLICMLVALLYTIYTPKKIIGTLTINKLNSTDANAYNELELIISEVIAKDKRADQIAKINTKEENKTKNDPYIISAPINSNANNIFTYLDISPDYIHSIFLDEISDKEECVEIVDKLNLVNKNEYETNNSYEDALRENCKNLRINRPITSQSDKIQTGREYQQEWTIEYEYSDADVILKVLNFILDDANKKSKLFLQNKFNSLVKAHSRMLNYEILDAERIINNSIEDYSKKINSKIEFLEEQSKIAKSMNLSNGMFNNILPSSSITSISSSDESYYLMGYIPIDKEIQLIKERYNPRSFVPNIIELESKVRELKQSNFLNYIEGAFKNTPIYSGEFKASNYDLADINLERLNFRASFIFLISILAFTALSTVYLIVSLFYKKNKI